MANIVNCDEARRPSYALSGPLVTKCATMSIKGNFKIISIVFMMSLKNKITPSKWCHWENFFYVFVFVCFEDAAGVVIKRDCHFESYNQKPNVCNAGINVEIGDCKICETDICNSGPSLVAGGITSLIAFIVAIRALCWGIIGFTSF